MLTLQQLRDHAASKPNHHFLMNDCQECLASDLTGGVTDLTHVMDREGNESPLPTPFALMVQRLVDRDKNDQTPVSGADLASALDKLIAGHDPMEVANTL